MKTLIMIYDKLKLGYSSIIPFPGFYAINLFGTVIRRKKYKNTKLNQRTHNHELIHTLQAEDFISNPNNKNWKRILGYCIFYILYFIEWIIRLILRIITFGRVKAYSGISFEQEAYNNESDYFYPDKRKRWAWTKSLFKCNRISQ